MTANSTSEPELEKKPVVNTDPPETTTKSTATDEPSISAESAEAVTDKVDDEPKAGESAVESSKTTPVEVDDKTTPVTVDEKSSAPVAAEPAALAEPAVATEPEVAAAEPETVVVKPEGRPVVTEVLVAGTDDEIVVDDEDGSDGDADPTDVPEGHYPTLVPLIGTLVGLAAVISILIAAFALPAVHSGPNKLPIGVAGTPAITSQLKTLFTANGSKNFDVKVYTQESAMRTAIKHRTIYGGLSVTGSSASMLVASAASPVAAEALGSVASELGSQSSSQIAVTDVVPLPKKDPRGDGLASIALPLVLASLLPALLSILLYRRRPGAQLGTALGASVLAALALSGILSDWLGATKGANYWLLSLGLAAGIAAASVLLLGLNAIAGRIGAGIGAAALVLIAAPLSGLATAPEWYSHPWGSIGQLLPAGAAATLLRSTAFFDGHGGGQAALVLGVWALIGLLLLVLGISLSDRQAQQGEPAELVD